MFNVGDEVIIVNNGGEPSYDKVINCIGKIECKRTFNVDPSEVYYYVRINGVWNDEQEYGYWACVGTMLTHAQTCVAMNEIKKENRMDILEIYKYRKIEEYRKQGNDEILDIKKMEKSFAMLYELSTDDAVKQCINLDYYRFSKETENNIDNIIKEVKKQENDLYNLIKEVEAHLIMCETYEQKILILQNYEIIDENGKIKA